MQIKHKLDATDLLCPMPVIKVQNKLKTLQPQETLEVTCTDPGALQDIPAWCRVHGHEVLSLNKNKHDIVICIKKCC